MALNFILDLLFPKLCFGCNKIGTYLCSSCHSKVVFTTIPLCPVCEKPSPFGFTHPRCKTLFSIDGMIVLGNYSGVLRKMIHFLKYKNVFSLGETLIDLFFTQPSPWFPKFDLISPIPLHRARFLERGYNQAAILAEILSLKHNWPYHENVLIRKLSAVPQMSILDNKTRRKNIKGAFVFNKEKNVENQIIGLVDDVATTGATIFEAAKVLKQNGANLVWGIVLARKFSSRP